MKKKFLACFLFFCLILSLFPSSVLASEEVYPQTETGMNAGTDTDTQTGTETNADTDTDSQTGTETGADTNGDTGAGTDTGTGTADTPLTADNALTSALTASDSETTVVSVINDTYKNASPHNVDLSNTTYSLTFDVDPTGFTGTPKLVVSIPEGITLSNYPTAANATLASYIQDVTSEEEENGSTTLTYTFNAGISTVGFNIVLLPTYKLKTGSTCTVAASVYDGDTEKGTASDSITVASNPTLASGAYYYATDALQYVDIKDSDYYLKADMFFYSGYPNHYDYDSLTITVPIPSNATPGYYEGDTFTALTEDTPYEFTDGTATYETGLTFTNDSSKTLGTGNAIVYELSASHPLTSSYYTSYYMYNSNMGGIYLRFPGNTEGGKIYTPGVSPKIVAKVDSDNYTLRDYVTYSDLSNFTISYKFRDYDVNSYVYPVMNIGYASVYTGNYLMPQADNQYFSAYLYNLTGNELTDVEVEYTGGYSGSDVTPLSADIHCYKLVFALSSSGVNPSTADVTYSYYDASADETKTDGHVYLTASDSTLSLDDGDYFTEIRATYDHIGASANAYSYISTLNAYCYNADNVNSGTCCYIYSKILSSTINAKPYGASTWTKTASTCFYPCTTLPTTPYYITLNGTSNGMDKGAQYSFYFYPASYGTVKNLCVYFLMPDGYEMQSYVPPSNWDVTGSDYTISSRPITVASDTDLGIDGNSYKVAAGTYTLYTLQYTDGADHVANGAHIVYFTLGPTVDTAEVKTGVCVPSAICMTTDSSVYPFVTYSNYQLTDTLDFDNDENVTETFARFYSLTTATQNAAKVISMSGSLTSSYEGGSGTSKFYQYNSTGNYTFTVYNGLDSGNTAQDAAIDITVPSTGTGISAELTGAPALSGDFLTGATATYSLDGGSNYVSESSVSNWSAVTNIKIVTASGNNLYNGESAYVTVPFNAVYGSSASAYSTSAFTANMSYSLYKGGTLSSTPSSTAQTCAMKTAPVPVSGTVYKDYDNDGIRDANEQNNGKSYSVTLYSGTHTSGTANLTGISNYFTNSTSGAFSFPNSIYQPGDYTLCVGLADTESLSTCSAGWTLDNGYAYYPFTVGDSVTNTSVSLALSAPRTLILNYTSCFLYDNATKKLVSTVLPALDSGENVTYESSNTDAVTVAADGTLTYVSDGTATITATVSGYNGGSNVTATCLVYARKSSYSITLNAGDNVTLSASGYALSSGSYTGSYISGSYPVLPTSSAMTNSDASCYFVGWYDNADFTGSPVTYISGTDYGDKTYYAKWDRYEAAYETAANTWVYGTFYSALSGVYNGGTIKLLRDVALYSIPTITSNITLKADGNARILTVNYYINVTSGSLTIDDTDLTITGSTYGNNYLIYVGSTGTMNLKAGTISSVSNYGIQNSGVLNVSGGTVECTNSSSYAATICNNNGGAVSITGGSIVSSTSAASTPSASNIPAAVYNSGSGTISITGGSITSSRSDGAAVCESSWATGTITVSGAPVISSVSKYTIECLTHTTDTAAISYFGKTYYSSILSNITLTGTDDESGNHVINQNNSDGAAVSAQNIQNGYAFIAWTSDSEHSSQLGTVNGSAVSSLKSTDDSPFTSVYAYLDKAPSSTPYNGSFTDTDTKKGKIGGTVLWTVPGNTSGIDSYYIYWGTSSDTIISKLAAADKSSSSYTVPDETSVPDGAACFLIYSHNAAGNSSGYLKVAFQDVFPVTVSGAVSKGLALLSDLSGITVTLYSSGAATSYTASTDSNGSFSIPEVPAGNYTAVVESVPGKYSKSQSSGFTAASTDISGITLSLEAPTFSVSGAVDTSLTTLTDKSGITVELYYKDSQSCLESYGETSTDSNGTFQFSDVPQGTYMAVIEGESGEYARSKSVFTLTDTDCSGLSIMLSAPFTGSYPVFVITNGPAASSGNYYVYEKKSDGGDFGAFSDVNAAFDSYTYSSIGDIITDISAESVGASPTLYFGASGTDAGSVSGSLDLGNKRIYLEGGGTYTIKGSIINAAIRLYDGTSLIIDGAYIESSGRFAVENEGSGNIKLIGGTVKCDGTDSLAIISDDEDGSIDISSGTVSGNSIAVAGANIHISGGNIECAGGPALVCLGGENTISGGTLTGDNSNVSFDPDSDIIPGTVLLYNESDSNKLTVSGGTIKNTASAGYAIFIYNWQDDDSGLYSSELRLTGHPSISGTGDIWTNTAIYADDGVDVNPAVYTGGVLTLCYGGSDLQLGTVTVRNVIKGTNDEAFSLTNTGYGLTRNNTDLVIATAQTAPTGLIGAAPTSKDGTDGSISGTTSGMEYKPASGSGDYCVCEDGSTAVGAAGDYLVRYAATGTYAASSAATVTVSPYNTHSVSGTVDDGSDDHSPVNGASVEVTQGNTQLGGTATTDAYGKFTVIGVPDGEYNLVVTVENRTVTQFITVSGQDCSVGTIALRSSAKNSVLDIQGNDTPDIVVNGLEQEADAQSDSSCTVTMTVEKKASDDAAIQSDASSIAVLAVGQTLEYLKIDVKKTANGVSSLLENLGNVQEIIIPYDFSGKTGIMVYRYHGNSASPFTLLNARPADLGAARDGSFYADSANGKIYIYTSGFSTYAIGYDTNSGGGFANVTYAITASSDAGGNISPSGVTSVAYGGSKTYTITPDDGYYISDVLVDGVSVGAVSSYTFKDVTQTHTIKAVPAKISGLPYYLDESGSKVFIGFASDKNGTMKYIAPKGKDVFFTPNLKTFTDISGHWAKSYIDFVTERDLFVGTAANIFSPDTGMTRAMFAAVIGRLYERSYGALPSASAHEFTDVKYDDYYGKYIDWESENNIITGIGGGLFDPDREITREEMATILSRFAAFLGASSAEYENTQLTYTDTASISSWAADAAKYCQQTGIIQGRDGGCFVPQGIATRAETAAILERFIETVV